MTTPPAESGPERVNPQPPPGSVRFCPAYPAPMQRRPSVGWMLFGKRRSWLDGLFVRSYAMKMGEVRFPGRRLYMLNEPPLVRRVLVERAADFPKHEMLRDALRPLLGDSIFTTNGAQWRQQRALMDPSFEAARLKLAFPRMQAAAQAMMQRLARVPDGGEHDLEVEMTHVTADIILRTILSTPLSGADARAIFEAFERYQALAPRLMMPAFFGLRWLRPWWLMPRARREAQRIRALLEGLIRPRHEAALRGERGPDDILESLLRARDADTGQGFDFEELVDQVAMLFLAGHETSASALSWALYLLAHEPDAQAQVQQEAEAVLALAGDDPGALKDMVFTRDVFRETLRLFPPVGFFARQCAHAESMRDKSLAPGSSVVVAPWLIHRHRGLWARPDEFDPWRFSRDEDELPSARESLRQAWLPFGAGPRVCIGAAFALQEAVLILGTLLLRYRLEPVPGHVPEPVGRLTIRSANGIRLRLHRRGS
jgi:cytochrome P450